MGTEAPAARIVLGLGNPGPRYEPTRHNVGFLVLNELRRRRDFGGAKEKFHCRCWTARVGGAPVTLAAPQTFMNASGTAAAELAAFYKVEPAGMLVVLDDMALPVGRVRARPGGSAGGHHGLDDVIAHLGTDRVPRLRIGIGPPPARMDAIDYVLGVFDESERPLVARAIALAADAVEDWIAHGIETVMNRYNQVNLTAGQEEDGRCI